MFVDFVKMLTNFRAKLNSVIQEGINLTEGLTVQYGRSTNGHPTSNSSESPNHQSTSNVPNIINLHAGHQILEQNESNWMSIREVDEQNAGLAKQIDSRISDILAESSKMLMNISDINASLNSLPNIVTSLKLCTEAIEEIGDKIHVCETKLMELEDLNEVLSLQEKQLDERFEMAMYKEKRMAGLDKVREDLAKEHSAKVVRQEKQMKRIQTERQLVFQDAFQNDLDYYKKNGNIPSKSFIILFWYKNYSFASFIYRNPGQNTRQRSGA